MQVRILEEAGYVQAIKGFGYSYKDRAITPDDFYTAERFEQIERAAKANAGRGKGHDKFLRQIMLWVDIEAPRYWWSEFDTYKVGTVAQSESTMHTLAKREARGDDFENGMCNGAVALLNAHRSKPIEILKGLLPEAYLQRRLVTMNYAVLRCIIQQREGHRLPEWQVFIEAIKEQVEHPEFLK